ncbi:MAG TPA: GAF domain-containing sensor histidine kinase [Mycobacteriales bacterium]|nr:GAF domain-containing sensor histidine kinase [Mycobacteriales bacterium]
MTSTAVARALPRPSVRVPAIAAGTLVALISAVQLYGWVARRAELIQLRVGQAPMQFNAAVCLALLGAAVLMLPTRMRRWSAVPFAVATVWGGGTLLQYVTGLSFGIDTLLFDPWLTVGTDVPGRMARNTALCFTMLGATGLWLAVAGSRAGAPLAAGSAGSLVAGLSLVALFGYAGGISSAYTWRTSTAMAPLTAVSLLILGVAFVAVAWGCSPGPDAPRWLPIPVAVGALAATLFLWEALVTVGGQGAPRTLTLDRAAGIALATGLVFSALLAGATALGQQSQRRRREAEALVARVADEATRASDFQNVLVRRTARDNVLRDAYAAVATAPGLKEGFDSFAVAARGGLAFERASLSLVGDDGTVVVAVTGASADQLPVGTVIPFDDPLVGEILRAREPYLDNDVAARAAQSTVVRGGVRAFVAAPVVVAGQPRAVLRFASWQPNSFTPDDLVMARELVNVVGGALYTLARLDDERQTTQRLRELDQLKNEFVGVVAHDLRSPMTVIVGYIETVLQHWDDLTDDVKRDLLGVASRNTTRLSNLVEDVLQVARIESGDFPYEIAEFDLGALVDRTVSEMNAARSDRAVVADVPAGLPKAYGDEDRQWRVLTNLISNAQKFSPPDTPVVVSVRATGDMLEVRVVDRGPGIPAEDLSRLFGKFSRLSAPPTGEKGTGLGLYICKALVEAQGGEVGAESRVGEGTTMRYTIPQAGGAS